MADMTTTLTAAQVSPAAALISWVTDQTPAGNWLVSRDIDSAGFVDIGAAPVGQNEYLSSYLPPNIGETVTYRLWADAQPFTLADPIVWAAATGAVDPLATDPRYTTMQRVKARLRIPDSTDTWDDRITAAIVSGEYAIDVELGQSFPNPTVDGIPVALGEAATNVAVRLYKAGDAPAGVAGSDDMFGALDLSEQVRAEIGRSPILRGFKVSWGVS